MAVLAVSWMTPEKVGGDRRAGAATPSPPPRFGGRGARLPAHALDAEAGGDQVGQDRGQRGVRREVGKEPGVVPVGDAGKDGGIELGEEALQGNAMLGWSGSEVAADVARLGRAHDGQVGQARSR